MKRGRTTDRDEGSGVVRLLIFVTCRLANTRDWFDHDIAPPTTPPPAYLAVPAPTSGARLGQTSPPDTCSPLPVVFLLVAGSRESLDHSIAEVRTVSRVVVHHLSLLPAACLLDREFVYTVVFHEESGSYPERM